MEERYIAAVDLGSSKIAVTVAQIDGMDIQIIYYRETPSQGVRNSMVFNPQKASYKVKEALELAESELRIKILQVVVGLPRYAIRQETARATLDRTDKEVSITPEEIEFLKTDAVGTYPLGDPEKDITYGTVAQSFSTEDYLNAHENDIVGMVSDTLDGNFRVFIGSKRASANVDRIFNVIDKACAQKYFVPESTARAVLTSEERENGVALVEIGAGTTSVTIYHNNILRHYASIPFGGQTVTNDIRIECGTSERLAENIKLAFGVCMPDKLLSLREKIIQINNKESGTCKQLSVKYLSEIITSRMKEIIEAVLYHIQQSGYADTLRSGVVITGGGASLPNLSSYFKELSGYNVRIGYPLHKFSSTGCSEVCDTSAAASVGMILAARDNTYLNCLSEKVELPTPAGEAIDDEEEEMPEETEMEVQEVEIKEAEQEAEAVQDEPRADGRLIDPEEFGEEVQKKKEKKIKKPKERKQRKPIINWSIFTEKISNTLDNTLGGLYDGMEE